jgi:hypothetical protein
LVFPAGNQVGNALSGCSGGEAVIPAPVAFLDVQIQAPDCGVGGPGDGVRRRNVRLAGAAAGIAQDLRFFVFDAFIGYFLEVFLDILIRHENGTLVF